MVGTLPDPCAICGFEDNLHSKSKGQVVCVVVEGRRILMLPCGIKLVNCNEYEAVRSRIIDNVSADVTSIHV